MSLLHLVCFKYKTDAGAAAQNVCTISGEYWFPECWRAMAIAPSIPPSKAAESRLALADLTIAEGRPADAESSAREARDQFRKENQADDELVAGSVLAKSLLEQGRFADAQLAVEGASTLAARSQNRGVSLRFAITAARVSAATT